MASTKSLTHRLRNHTRDRRLPIDYDTAVTVQGCHLRTEIDAVLVRHALAEGDHTLTVQPVEHHELTLRAGVLLVGGLELHHGECCPGRVDVQIFAPQIRLVATEVPANVASK